MKGMLKENSLVDKVILVTGGGSGLGKSMVKYFLELGANIIITSRREELLNDVAKDFNSKYDSEVFPIACDVRKIEEVEKVINESYNKFGKIDCLVNNAAGNFISPTERLSTRAFDAVIDIVLKGTINFTLTLGKKWIKDKSDGNILNIVTTYSWTGSGYVVPSACAKAGVLSMTRSLAVEWAKYKIRSNAIAPGPFPTKGAWERLLPGDLKEKFDPSKKVPVGRVGEHQELSNLAAYLLSDYSSYINGEVITIDGAEWLKGAGQFNHLEMITDQMWDMFEMMRKKKQ
jgi:NAD(P)-dependent dehydrogenase (short-subunit alcohol dehydrogenase family)|tara:strand:+ start:10213 stop:11076 length:864 start_codon:yes stop_codon:yes gene_type:complete